MKKLHVTLNGTNTLMMHSPKTVNPLHPLALELKKYTSKRKKTEDDLMKISELEWEAGLYYDETNGLHIPRGVPAKDPGERREAVQGWQGHSAVRSVHGRGCSVEHRCSVFAG